MAEFKWNRWPNSPEYANGIVCKPKRTYRNPIILAQEMALTMEYEELSKADLGRILGCSRARVTQLLHLLNLPQDFLHEIMEMGDHWDRQLVTERQLRRKLLYKTYIDNSRM